MISVFYFGRYSGGGVENPGTGLGWAADPSGVMSVWHRTHQRRVLARF